MAKAKRHPAGRTHKGYLPHAGKAQPAVHVECQAPPVTALPRAYSALLSKSELRKICYAYLPIANRLCSSTCKLMFYPCILIDY